MSIVTDKSVLERYPDGSKCTEYIKDLSNSASLSWEEAYWRAKYLYTYGRELCTNYDLIVFFNACFNQGLSVNANRDYYMDARKMQSALYILEEDFKMASNCIQAVLDITEDIPAEMFLDLTYAEIHTDLLRILKSPAMFFNDLHEADSDSALHERQKTILCKLLRKAAEAKSKDSNITIDLANIEKEVATFGLSTSEDYILLKKVLGGETVAVTVDLIKPKPQPQIKPKPELKPTSSETSGSGNAKPVSEKPQKNGMSKRDKDGLLVISIFPDDEPEESIELETDSPAEVAPRVVAQPNADVRKPDDSANTANSSSIDLKNIETMFASLMAAVNANASQISELHGKMQKISDDSEFARISAELEEGEAKNKALMEQLAAANERIVAGEQELEAREKLLAKSKLEVEESQKKIAENQRRIAEKEAEKAALEEKLAARNALLVAKKNAEFGEDDLKSFETFERVIIIDTCAIEHEPELLDYVTDREMVRISQTVLQELENHKKYKYDIEMQKMGQRGLKAIHAAKKALRSCDYEDCYTFLLPESLRIKEDDDIGTANDKEIFSVALRYKIHSNVPVLIISDDTTMLVMADSAHIESMTSGEFVAGRERYVVPSAPTVPSKPTKEQFLSQKLKHNEYTLSMAEVMVLRSNGIETIGDLLEKTESDLAFIRDKKGINYKTRMTQVYEKAKKHYDSMFADE